MNHIIIHLTLALITAIYLTDIIRKYIPFFSSKKEDVCANKILKAFIVTSISIACYYILSFNFSDLFILVFIFIILYVKNLLLQVSWADKSLLHFIIYHFINLLIVSIYFGIRTLTNVFNTPTTLVTHNITKFLLLILGLLFLVETSSDFLTLFLSRCLKTKEKNSDNSDNNSKLIGQLERIIIYVLVLKGNLEATSIVLAAKSLLRIEIDTGEKNKKNNVKQASEYIIIGTLASFSVGIIISVIIQKLLTLL